MLKEFRFYVSPYFISKYYIRRDILRILDKYSFEGSLLDIGCGEKPYKKFFKKIKTYIGIDFPTYSKNKDYRGESPDLFFGKDYLKNFKLSQKNNSYDSIVAFQVLEHHKKPNILVQEMFRIVKPGGYILITVPFLGGIHEAPKDFQRFTKYGLLELLKPYGRVLELKEEGSLLSTISMLLNENLNSFASKNKLRYILSVIIYPIFLMFQYSAIIFDIFIKSNMICFNYIILCKKNENLI